MTDHPCPTCGSPPTAESLAEQHLSDLGYLHDDRFLVCSRCENQWTVGIPRGETGDDTWVCDACGGDFMPHFVNVFPEREEVHVRPKCQDCYWVPDNPKVLDCSTSKEKVRFFVGHHETTGNREEASRDPIEYN